MVWHRNAILTLHSEGMSSDSPFRCWKFHDRLYRMLWKSSKSLAIRGTGQVELKTSSQLLQKSQTDCKTIGLFPNISKKKSQKGEHQPEESSTNYETVIWIKSKENEAVPESCDGKQERETWKMESINNAGRWWSMTKRDSKFHSLSGQKALLPSDLVERILVHPSLT